MQLTLDHAEFNVSVLIFGILVSALQIFFVFCLVEKAKMQSTLQNIIQRRKTNEENESEQKIITESTNSEPIQTLETETEQKPPETKIVYAQNQPQTVETAKIGLQLRNVYHKYNNKSFAVNGFSIDIPKGQIFGLLGSNGSGKSTLMHCLAGMYKPQGNALLEDNGKIIDLFQLKNPSQYFSVVPQNDIFWPGLTIMQHLRLMQLYNAMDVDIELLLKELKLTEFKNQAASTLSGGQKRRLSIAMAMTMRPRVIAFDEPSCGLGVTTKRFVHQAILGVLSKDTTLLLTTHDMEEVEALADECCIMHFGRILKTGSVARMCSQQKFDLKIRGNNELVQVLMEELQCTYPVKNAVCDFWCFTITNMDQLQIIIIFNIIFILYCVIISKIQNILHLLQLKQNQNYQSIQNQQTSFYTQSILVDSNRDCVGVSIAVTVATTFVLLASSWYCLLAILLRHIKLSTPSMENDTTATSTMIIVWLTIQSGSG
ncbi:ABC_transporter family protein [Hexamita inflata]|uniref:ABC_transporter family protein n=1 Tax=Hexamita inflata TaxID=28002 RepID=A0ABP1H6U1_9EUKA